MRRVISHRACRLFGPLKFDYHTTRCPIMQATCTHHEFCGLCFANWKFCLHREKVLPFSTSYAPICRPLLQSIENVHAIFFLARRRRNVDQCSYMLTFACLLFLGLKLHTHAMRNVPTCNSFPAGNPPAQFIQASSKTNWTVNVRIGLLCLPYNITWRWGCLGVLVKSFPACNIYDEYTPSILAMAVNSLEPMLTKIAWNAPHISLEIYMRMLIAKLCAVHLLCIPLRSGSGQIWSTQHWNLDLGYFT